MEDENQTAAVVRRLGGGGAVGRKFGLSRQAVNLWVQLDRFPGQYVDRILSLCIADNLPTDHPQLREAKAQRPRHAY